jgi:hypothetical protein
MEDFQLDLVVAGTTEGVMMVESEAKELSEDVMLGAVKAGHESFQAVIDAIIQLAEKAAKGPVRIRKPGSLRASEVDPGHRRRRPLGRLQDQGQGRTPRRRERCAREGQGRSS